MHSLSDQSASTSHLSWVDGAGKLSHASIEQAGRQFEAQILRAGADLFICALLERVNGGQPGDTDTLFSGSEGTLATAKVLLENEVRKALGNTGAKLAIAHRRVERGIAPLS